MISNTVSFDSLSESDQLLIQEKVDMHPLALPPPPNIQTRREYHHVKWSKVQERAAKNSCIPAPRHGHRAIAYKHLMIVFSGGNEGMFSEVSVFNTLTNEWSQPQVKGDIPPGKAAYGAVIDGHRILIFGGMEEHLMFSDTLYELNANKWEWTLLNPKSRTEAEKPCGRIGHSFTLIKDRIFLFGGLQEIYRPENGRLNSVPKYLDDLHVLYFRQNMQHGVWEQPIVYGTAPSPRESHTAVSYVSKDLRHNKLVIYGGMYGKRLGDLFTLDVDTMMWCEIKYEGRSYRPLPRSLHTASVIGDRMYVFGGWVERPPHPIENSPLDFVWHCDNEVICLNLKTVTWERVISGDLGDEHEVPAPRAGHSAAVINNKVYVWSGRDGYRKGFVDEPQMVVKQVCFGDLWKLDVQKPGVPDKVKLIKAMSNGFVVGWDPVPGADGYILQCMKFEMPLSATVDGDEKELLNVGPPFAPAPSNALIIKNGVPCQNFPPQQPFPMLPRHMLPSNPGVSTAQRMISSTPANVNANDFGLQHPNIVPPLPPTISTTPIPYPPGMYRPVHQVNGNFMPHSSASQPAFSYRPGLSVAPPLNPPSSLMTTPSCPPMIPVSPSGIAPQFNWQMVRGQNPLTRISRTNVQELIKILSAQYQQRQTVSPSMQPANNDAVSSTPPTTPAQSSENSDSSLMPPPTTAAPSQTSSCPCPTSQPLIEDNTSEKSGQATPSSTNAPGFVTVQRSGNYVRILNHSPNQQQSPAQKFSLTGSHGIPGSNPVSSQIIRLKSVKPPSNRIHVVHNNQHPSQTLTQLQHQGAQRTATPLGMNAPPLPMIRLSPQQVQSLIAMHSRPGSTPIRFVTPSQIRIARPAAPQNVQAPRYFVTYEMSGGSKVATPTEIVHGDNGGIKQIRLPTPLPLRKEDGRKMVAIEGMLQLASGHDSKLASLQQQSQGGSAPVFQENQTAVPDNIPGESKSESETASEESKALAPDPPQQLPGEGDTAGYAGDDKEQCQA